MSDAPSSPEAPPAAESPPREPPASRKRALAILGGLIFAGLIVPLIAILVAMRGCSRSQVSGRLELTGSPFGEHRLTLDRCRASTTVPDEIELGNEKTPALIRVTVDPLDGPILTLFEPSGDRTLTVLTRPCPGFTAKLKRTSADDAPTPRYDGEVSGTCAHPGDGTVAISVWFRGCGA